LKGSRRPGSKNEEHLPCSPAIEIDALVQATQGETCSIEQMITSEAGPLDCLLPPPLGNTQSRSPRNGFCHGHHRRQGCALPASATNPGRKLCAPKPPDNPARLARRLTIAATEKHGVGHAPPDPSRFDGRSPPSLKIRRDARLLSLEVLQPIIDVAVIADPTPVAHIRSRDFAAPAPATGKAKAE